MTRSRRPVTRVGAGSLREAASPGVADDRTASVVQVAVPELDVACACGKGRRKFPTADVRAGRCQWGCGRRGCEPST